MRDFIADWKRWSLGERALAIGVALLLAAVPLGLMLTGKSGV